MFTKIKSATSSFFNSVKGTFSTAFTSVAKAPAAFKSTVLAGLTVLTEKAASVKDSIAGCFSKEEVAA